MTIIRKAEIRILHRDPVGRTVRVHDFDGALAWHDERPDVVWLVSCAGTVDVTLDGMSLALIIEVDEPSGAVTMRPNVNGDGRDWWIADVDTADGHVEYTVAHGTVAGFVVDVALHADLDGARVQDGAA